jgi:hypothetical protein
MSSTTLSSGAEIYYVFIAVVFIALARVTWRTIANYKGTAFSLAKTVAYAGVYIALGALFSGLSFLAGVSYLLAVPELILAATAAFWSYKYTDRRISFWKKDNGSLYFRGGIAIYLIYLVGFIARLSIDVAFIGPSMFNFTSSLQLSGVALYGSMVTDLVLVLGSGLLIGRYLRVSRRYRAIMRGEEVVPGLPIPPAL